MSALPLFRRALADSWRGLIGWGLGLTAVVAMYLPLYPSIGGNPQFVSIIESMPPELIAALNFDQITSGAGYTLGTVYGLLGFVLLTIAAAGWGANAIAGDEERGTLELTLAHGVSRPQIVLERLAAIMLKVVALVLWVTLLVAALNEPSDLTISSEGIIGGGLALLGTGLVTVSLALLAGAITGRRSIAVGVGAGSAVLGYAFNALGNQSSDLEWLHAVSPYHWAFGTNPLEGAMGASVWLLYAVALVASVVSVLAFQRRDIGV